jgi:plasmid stability protein
VAGRSAETEQCRILEEALFAPHKRSLAEVLAAMPDVGRDADFARVETTERAKHVFDPKSGN